ncbi:MAG: hypothetical protein WBD55_02265 [Dehalococcoidia bacterium]
MLRAISIALLLVLTAVLGAGCLVREDSEPIDYLQLEDAIIIQVLDVPGGLSPLEARLTLPSFTLYGDGTLIRAAPEADGSVEMTRAEVPEDAVRDLVEFMVGKGFLETYVFEDPGFDGPSDAATSYIYLNTEQGANSVRAVALDRTAPAGASDDHRRLVQIRNRLMDIDDAAVGGRIEGAYKSEGIALFAQAAEADGDSYVVWPLGSIDLAKVAGLEGQAGKVLLSQRDAASLPASRVETFVQGSQAYEVGYRPALPFEEHFPEFDFP